MSSIPLYVSNTKAYIWDPQHAATLRVTHHICGLATGTLPGVGQQNVFLGLPLVLMPEEVVLLVEDGKSSLPQLKRRLINRIGICHLVYTPTAFRPPTTHEIAQHTAARLESVEEMQEAAVALVEEKKRAFAMKRESGKGKREKRREVKESGNAEAEEGLFKPDPVTTTPSTKPPSTTPYFTTVPSHPTPSTHPWFDPCLCSTYTSLSSAREAGVWAYPRTALERARCATYREVWTKGMFMGQGVKFGGEFLVYPGALNPT
jgi:tRNA-splicing endonuclease subunit Sen34